jgi:hypothetical protein
MATDLARVALVGLVAVAACTGDGPITDGTAGCSVTVKPAAVVNLGPDLILHGTCGGVARGAVASVSESAGGLINWSASIDGDPSLGLDTFHFTSCASSGPQVVLVRFAPPLSAKPGDGFDAVVTVRADHDAFPTGTVKVHGQVERPVVTATPQMIDFGDVSADAAKTMTLSFRNESGAPIDVVPPTPDPRLPFDLRALMMPMDIAPGGVTQFDVEVNAFPPGDYSTTFVWATTSLVSTMLPDGCTGIVMTAVHAHIVPPDGGVDGATD